MSNDFAVGTVGAPQVGKLNTKPRYLVSLTGFTKNTTKLTYFLALDKPDRHPDFIDVKGFYVEGTDDEIISSLAELVANTPKEAIEELMIPTHRVFCIKSLIFNANKSSTLFKSQ
jgi:hypothetical protein